MSTRTPSRATLEDVISAIRARDLPARRRDDMVSAVRTVARVLGKLPHDIEADPRRLALRLADVSAPAVDLSPGRWNNIRSLFRAALALVRPMMKGRSAAPMSPAWMTLHAALITRGQKTGLSRLLRWLSDREIEPAEVTLEDLALFQSMLASDSLVRNASSNWRSVAYFWNQAIQSVAGWPAIVIDRQPRRDTFSLPWSDFPLTLKQDVDAWLRRLAGDVFDDDGPARPARPATLQTREYQLRAFASALVRRGVNAGSLRSLADLVEWNNYCEGLKFFHERRGGAKTSAIHGTATMLKSVALHWVKVGDGTLQKMGALARRLAPEQTGMTEKNRERLRALDDDEKLGKLLLLPWRLMEEAESGRLKPHQAALRAQYAVAIELLLFIPVRRKNLAEIEIDRQLVRTGDRLHLIVPQHQVKNRVDLEFEIPRESASLIERYLEQHRPHLCNPESLDLFPGAGGAPKAGNTLGRQLQQIILKYTGLKMTPHLFRHAGGKLYLDINPGGYEAIRRVLGHKSLETTTKFYLGQETRSSARHFDKVIRGLRETHSSSVRKSTSWRPALAPAQGSGKRRRCP